MSAARKSLFVAIVLGLTVSTTYGVVLQDLLTGQTVTHGDKVFGNFFVIPTGMGTYTFDPATIEVTPVVIEGNLGLLFAGVSSGMPIVSAGPNSYIDVLIGFDVTVTDPEWSISDIHLSFDATTPVDGFAQIVETAKVGPVIVGQIQVQTPPPSMSAEMDFLPQSYTKLSVVKDILVLGGGSESSDVWSFTQSFSQIPEPTTLTLLGFGLVAFLRPRRLRNLGAPLAVALAVVGVLGGSQSVQALPLQTLIDTNGTITQQGKVFSDFTFTIDSAQGRYIASAAGLDVSGVTLGDEDGIRFAGALAAFSNLQPNSAVTVTITYKVTAPAGVWITDASLGFNGAVTIPQATATVEEDIFANGPLVGELAVAAPTPLSDHILLDGMYQTLDVVKTVTLSGGSNGVASISFINQTYSQIPEPATVGLLALGSSFLLRRRIG